jgi:hypothetical protein
MTDRQSVRRRVKASYTKRKCHPGSPNNQAPSRGSTKPRRAAKPSKIRDVPDLIPPKHEIELAPAVRTHCRVPREDMEKIAEGAEHFYFLDEIKYLDGISMANWHITQFAKELVIDIATNGPQEAIGSAVSRGRHNCADNDCPK